VITYRGKSAAREVGKALDLDDGQIDRLARVMHQFEYIDPDETLAGKLAEVGMQAHEPRVRHFAELWRQMQDLPRHLGQHSGGMVVCQGELSSIVPLENASMPGRVVVQWDKEDCADMGLIKVDLLGLGMMAVLQDTLTLINTGPPTFAEATAGRQANGRTGQQEITLASLPPDDPQVYEMLRAAETIGVFQVESRAQMATLPRLRPEKFYDLVVEVALIRPGPIVGQMVHPYLNRRAGREEVTYDHPLLEPILKRTLGVPLFQEQLLRMAMAVAGFTGGQAEDLRRAMGFKRSEKRMKQLEGLLREGMAKHGILGEVADKIVLSITSFALYGFPESHAASFALLAYASAYFKVHYPAAFFAALLNNQPMGFYHPATLVKDAQRRGVVFQPIDVQVSAWNCTVEGGAVRLGLRYVRGLREEAGKAIANTECKMQNAETRCPKCGCDDPSMLETPGPQDLRTSGPQDLRTPGPQCFCNVCSHSWQPQPVKPPRFHSIDDLVRRVPIRRDEIAMLAEIGALNSLGHDRRSALWQVERAIRPAGELFEPGPWNAGTVERLEPIGSPLEEMTVHERLVADYTGTGLTVGPHPLTFRRQDLAMRGVLPAIALPMTRSGRRVRTAGMVITRQRPGTAKGFVFLTLEDETGISNIIIRPDLYAANRLTVVESSFLLVEGILQNLDGVTSIKAERMSKLDGFPDEAAIDSHDFH
jgi:error-prone DNA polymerase